MSPKTNGVLFPSNISKPLPGARGVSSRVLTLNHATFDPAGNGSDVLHLRRKAGALTTPGISSGLEAMREDGRNGRDMAFLFVLSRHERLYSSYPHHLTRRGVEELSFRGKVTGPSDPTEGMLPFEYHLKEIQS